MRDYAIYERYDFTAGTSGQWIMVAGSVSAETPLKALLKHERCSVEFLETGDPHYAMFRVKEKGTNPDKFFYFILE